MHKLMVLAGAALALHLGLPAISFGQASAINGQIEGTVTDPSGALVPRARIEVRNEGTGFDRAAETDDSGFYRFTVLPLGDYAVSAKAAGFAPFRQTGVVLGAGHTATVNIALQVGGVAADVVITGDAPVIEPGRTDLGSTLGRTEVENLPLVSRNNFNYILVQPNVSGHPNTEFGVPRKINANGFADRINYQLDGSNNTESDRAGIRLMPVSNTWIEEVQQVNNGFAPEFGNTTGTVFNAITKSGTNTLHGEGGYLFRRTDFSARSTLLKPTDAKPTLNVDDYFADAGGRIIKDKLFFFGSFEHVKRDLPMPVTVSTATIALLGLPASYAQAIPFSQSNYFYLGKADYQIDESNRLSGKFSYFRNESPFNASSFTQVIQTETYLFKDRAPAYSIQLISALSSTAVNEFRFQTPKRFQRQVAFEGTGAQPVLQVAGVANFGGSDQIGLRFIETTPEVSDNLSYNIGTHSVKVGGDMRFIRDDNTSPTFARYTFASVADYLAAAGGASPRIYTNYTQTFGNPQIKYNSLFTGLYLQDNWKMRPNVTLNYGMRYDLYAVPRADSSSLFGPSRQFKVDKNNFAPRLGIAYSPGKDQKTVFRLNAGMFYDAPQTDVYRRALLNNGKPQFFNLSTGPGNAFAPSFPTVLTALPTGFNLPVQDITGVAKEFRTLYSTTASFQIDRQLSRNLSLSASYLFTKGTHLPVYRNVNLVPSGATLADGRPIFGTARILPQFNNVIVAESVGNSNYNGLNVTLNRRFARGYNFFATYTWSHAIDDAPEQNVIDSGALLPSDPTNRRRDRANSLTDRRHALTASGVLNPQIDAGPLGWLVNHNQLSFLLTAMSGDVFNIGSNRVLNNDQSIPSSLQRPLFVGRNTVRGPNIYELNMRYARLFPIRERVHAEFIAEFTNLLNHSNITGLNTTATVDTLGAILAQPSLARTSALDPRLMQLGFRVNF